MLKGVAVRAAMLTDFHTVGALDPLGHAVELLLAGTQHDFPVISPDGRALQGVLTRSDLMTGLANGGRDALVREYMKPDIHNVEAQSPLADAIVRLRGGEGPCLQVFDRGRPVGLLTPENVAEYLMVRAALGDGSSRGRAGEPNCARGSVEELASGLTPRLSARRPLCKVC